MDIDAALEFLGNNHRAVLATTRADGRPQLSPIVAGPGSEGTVFISSRETAMKTRNVLRRPEVSLCVLSDGFFGQWVQIDGVAEVIGLPDALPLLEDYYRTVSGEHPDWDEYRQAMIEERRVIIAITPLRAGPDRSG